jgi:MFS family permease
VFPLHKPKKIRNPYVYPTVFVHVALWGVVVASSSAAHDFKGLLTARFFIGIFEATVAPCFITITQMWWRRREQTMRLAIWMAANGGTGMVCLFITDFQLA